MKKIKLKTLMNVTIVGALYVALTLLLAPLSYGAVQFRLSELLMILVLYNPIYSISMIFGCMIANLSSPMAQIDIWFGTLATIISIIPMLFIKNKPLASLFPALVNAIVIGLELKFAYELPFLLSAAQVFIGEFVVVTIIGLPVFKSIEKNEFIVSGLELKVLEGNSKFDKYFTSKVMMMFAMTVIGLLLYFKLGLFTLQNGDNQVTYSLFAYTFGLNDCYTYPILISLIVIPLMYLLSAFLLKGLFGLICDIVLSIAGILLLVFGITISSQKPEFYYYFYFTYFVLTCLISYLFYYFSKKKENQKAEIEEIQA